MKKILSLLLLLSAAVIFLFMFLIIAKERSVVHSLPELVKTKAQARGEKYLPLSQIPQMLQLAVIDTEDRTFYSNPGISFEGTGRSLLVDLVSGRYSEGGSTITQQLARNLFLTDQKTITRKMKEMILAVMITNQFSKRDILDMYLNSVYFGHGAWGIHAAARVYFAKPATDLDIAQCTLLAGLPQAPSFLDPYSNYRAARSRQAEVLQSMVEAGHIGRRQAAQIQDMPLGLAGH
jgi:penicillin-binding protein 1A